MPPREANNPFADQYLMLEYDATTMMLPHDAGPEPAQPGDNNADNGMNTNVGMDMNVDTDPADGINQTPTGNPPNPANADDQTPTPQPPTEVLFQTGGPPGVPANLSGESHPEITIPDLNVQPTRRRRVQRRAANSDSNRSDIILDVDPLAFDASDPDEEEAWNLIEEAIASASENCVVTRGPRTDDHGSDGNMSYENTQPTVPVRNSSTPMPPLNSMSPDGSRRRTASDSTPPSSFRGRGSIVTPLPGDILSRGTGTSIASMPSFSRTRSRRRRSHMGIGSVLDQDPSMSCSDDEDDDVVPPMDTTQDTSTTTMDESEMSSPPGTPQSSGNGLLSPVRRMLRGESNIFHSPATDNLAAGGSPANVNIVTDDDYNSSGSSFTTPGAALLSSNFNHLGAPSPHIPPMPLPFASGASARSSSTSSGRSIHWNSAFDNNSANFDGSTEASSTVLDSVASAENMETASTTNATRNTQINLSFGPNTTVSDLRYFSERGCIVPLLRALHSPHLKTLGTRMLADYAKMPHRRVAVASNKRILEFCCRTMLEMPSYSANDMGTDWPAREYAVETIRSLTATEDSDKFLMGCNGLLKALAVVARGGPFASYDFIATGNCQMTPDMGLVSGKARLHACIAIMNLSCGKANKIAIASIGEVLDAMRDVMMAKPENFSPATSSPSTSSSSSSATPKSVSEEARLKAATCIKNLSNADRNDAALLGADGLIEALAYVASKTCSGPKGATNCTTNACLALMNLSISKANKHKVFSTEGVMDALMTVLENTSSAHGRRGNANNEARIKACSALSNLAIGYENKIPMFNYEGFVKSILKVIETDTGEARTKACSILWSFAAEMKNQVPVVQRGDILPTLVRVAEEDNSNEARFKCVAALTLLAESLDNAMPLLESGALHPLMDILHDAGADPTQWKGQTASWCVGFLMNMSQSDEAAPYLREAGVVELLAPLLTLEHYQSLKAAMAVTFVCRYDEDDETYELLRQTENVIPKIIGLLHNTLAGVGGNGYKYGVFTLRSSVGCISSLASGPEFMKERISTKQVFDSLLRVVNDFCVHGGTNGAIVGGGRDDTHSATLAIRALQSLTEYLIPIPGSCSLPFGPGMDSSLMTALESFAACTHPDILDKTRDLAKDAFNRIQSSLDLNSCPEDSDSASEGYSRRRVHTPNIIENSIVASLVQGCCIGPSLHAGFEDGFFPSMIRTPVQPEDGGIVSEENLSESSSSSNSHGAIRTFLLTDSRTGRRFCVPTDPSGGRAFNDGRLWCYRRGRFVKFGESPDPNYQWTEDLQAAYVSALGAQQEASPSPSQSSLSSTPGFNSLN